MSEPTRRQVQVTWPDEWPQSGYANVILVNHTSWDFSIKFGALVLPAQPPVAGPDELLAVEASPVVQVTLPPLAVAQLLDILKDQLEKYQATYGPIGRDAEARVGPLGDGGVRP